MSKILSPAEYKKKLSEKKKLYQKIKILILKILKKKEV